MMNTSQLSSFLVEEAFKGGSIEQPGSTYAALCRLFPLKRIRAKKNHFLALNVLTKLSDFLHKVKLGNDDKKQILEYMDALSLLVEQYEEKHFAGALERISGIQVLEFLMEQHSLRQSDLIPELGSQSIVSELLSRKRRLNSHQISVLSRRFGVSPSVFFP